MTRWLILLSIFFVLNSCDDAPGVQWKNYNKLTAYTEEGDLQAVIEIPAGTNQKIEYDKRKGKFDTEIIDGKKRVIQFLPYPGNYGFIPGTLMDKEKGGDGDALDVLVLGTQMPTGSIAKIRPIGTLLLMDNGEIDTKIIAIPLDEKEQIIKARYFQDFIIEYDAAKRIIEEWFTHYKGMNKTKLIRWEDEDYALKEIEKWKQ